MNENLPDMNSIDMLLNISVVVRVMMFKATFNNSSAISGSFIGGENMRKAPTCCKLLAHIVLYGEHIAIRWIRSRSIGGDMH
jgi:hypothetical protein